MSVVIRIPTQLRGLTEGSGEVVVSATTVGDAFNQLKLVHQGIEDRLFDESGSLRRFVNVFVEEEDIRFQNGLDTPVSPGQTISILPAVAGG